MKELDNLKSILSDILGIDTSNFDESTELLGSLPEFDSMAVVGLLVALEESFSIEIAGEDISAETFETLGSLLNFINK